jgi:hypothetical protein
MSFLITKYRPNAVFYAVGVFFAQDEQFDLFRQHLSRERASQIQDPKIWGTEILIAAVKRIH